MMRCQPARWKKVADAQPPTNASHRDAARSSPSDRRFTSAECSADGIPESMSPSVRLFQDELIDPVPAEITQQLPQPRLCPPEIHVMAEARLEIDARYSRLVDIDFPWMEIEDRRLPIDFI